jgi:hypothetical protein
VLSHVLGKIKRSCHRGLTRRWPWVQLTLFAVLWPACGWSQAELWAWAAQERGAAKTTVAQTPKRLGVRLNLEAVLAADEAVVELTSRGLQLSGLATWVEYDARRLRLLEVRLRDRSDDALLLHYEEARRVMVVVQRSLVGRLPPVVLRFAVEGVGIVRLRMLCSGRRSRARPYWKTTPTLLIPRLRSPIAWPLLPTWSWLSTICSGSACACCTRILNKRAYIS